MGDKLKSIILADPASNSWTFANSMYQHIQRIQKENGEADEFELAEVKISRFPDGEFEPRIMKNCRNREVVFVHDSSKNPSQWWVELMLVNDAARKGSATKIIDVLPYVRWSRGEKKDKSRIPIPASVMAHSISSYESFGRADRIISLDLHAPAIQGFFHCPVDALNSAGYAARYIQQNFPDIIKDLMGVAPDSGSAERVRKFVNKFDGSRRSIDIAIIDKKRKSGTQVDVYKVVGEVAGKNCLEIDDILSTGSTIKEGAIALRKEEARNIFGYVTHFVGSGDYKRNLEELDMFFTTNSFYHPEEDYPKNTKIIDVSEMFAIAAYRAKNGDSISELFD